MGIIIKNENYRVIVEARKPFWLINDDKKLDQEMKSRCEDIVQQIKRHIDDVSYVGLDWDVSKQCEFCGSDWTEDSKTSNGGCCDKDEENNPVKESEC